MATFLKKEDLLPEYWQNNQKESEMWISTNGIYLNKEAFPGCRVYTNTVTSCMSGFNWNVLLELYMFQFSLILKLLLELSSVV